MLSPTATFAIRPLQEHDRPWVSDLLTSRWAGTDIVTRGRVHRADSLPGFAAVADDGEPIGLVTYDVGADACEIVSLDSVMEGHGVGTALIKAVQAMASTTGCERLWLVTTNDNVRALRFYQKRGFVLAALHRDAIERSRQLKSTIPAIGADGIPIRDEIELELILRTGRKFV